MKKYSLLIVVLLAILAGCSPYHYYEYNRDDHRTLSVRERLDRRAYSLNIEREIHSNPNAASRSGRVISSNVRDFVLSVEGDRLYNMRDHSEYRISNYRDSRTSQCRTIRFSNYYGRGHSLEGKYELSVYNDGYFRLIIRNRNNSIRHEYEGWMIRDRETPGYHHPRR